MARKQPKVQYKLNMVKIFNRAFVGENLSKKNQLRAFISDPSVKLNYGRAVISKIQERTEKGIDKRSVPLKRYSKSYAKSDIFRIFGKTRKVDMTLSGEMLASMIPIPRIRNREVVIEFQPDQNNKAHGHVNGSRILPKRDFFGLPKDVESDLLKRIVTDAVSNNLIGIAGEFLQDIASGAQIGDQVIESGEN